MDFANTLKNLRESNNVTQDELAKYLKVSRPTIAGYETKNHQPDFERLIKISEYFHVTLDYLIKGTDLDKSSSNSSLDQEVQSSYQRLSLDSRQDVLKYIRLLELRDRNKK